MRRAPILSDRGQLLRVCALKCDDLSRIGGESTNTLTRRPDAIYHLRARTPPPTSLAAPVNRIQYRQATAAVNALLLLASACSPSPRVRPASSSRTSTPSARAGRTEQASNR